MREIKFILDNDKRVVIKVIDQRTKEVIREIPSEEFSCLAEDQGDIEGASCEDHS
jgi:uncharacterized FlaG/YvyC family protein